MWIGTVGGLTRYKDGRFTVYRDDPRSLPTVRAGMALYDLLAMFRNTHPHSILAAAEALAREPALRPEGLSGVALYWDCRMDDARLCLENVLAAGELGAEVANYLEVTGFIRQSGRVRGARRQCCAIAGDAMLPNDLIPVARLWLERHGRYLLGEREAALLSAIDHSRSIKEAARAAAVSYRTAWACLQSMERTLSRPVVQSRAGGVGGGATTLTDDTRSLVEVYTAFTRRAVVAVEHEFRNAVAEVAGGPATG